LKRRLFVDVPVRDVLDVCLKSATTGLACRAVRLRRNQHRALDSKPGGGTLGCNYIGNLAVDYFAENSIVIFAGNHSEGVLGNVRGYVSYCIVRVAPGPGLA
jgi:hypothetical protein